MLRTILTVTIAVACTLLPIMGQVYSDSANGSLMLRFRSYYCASLAAREHQDPYRVSSVSKCERTMPAPFRGVVSGKATVILAGYPPYVLALIAPLTRLNFFWASLVWWGLLGLACVAAAFMLAKVAQLPFLVAWAALALSLGLSSLTTGLLLPISVMALIFAAYFAQRGQWGFCGLAAALAMTEPLIALPAVIALFVRYRWIRSTLLLACALLVALSFQFGGLALNVTYFKVIVADAVPFATGSTAIALGLIGYSLMTAFGVFLGVRMARRHYEPAFVTLIPPAVILVGLSLRGTVEFAAAIPVCLLLYSYTFSYRRAAIAPLILLAVPWLGSASAALLLAPFFPIAYLAYMLGGHRRVIAFAVGLASLGAVAFFVVLASPTTVFHASNLMPLLLGAPGERVQWLTRAIGLAGLGALLIILSSESGLIRLKRISL